jgi:hypothetical protein
MTENDVYIRFSPRILDHLGLSAYNSIQKCVAEIVANSYDADAKEVLVTLPDVIDENAITEIIDDGSGMTRKEVAEKFLFIGRNKREEGQRTESKRLVIGSKGIGKLAGFGIASRIELTTWKDGEQSIITIDRHSIEDIQTLSEYALQILSEPSDHKNGTRIRLFKPNEGVHLPSTEVVRRYLYKHLPKSPDFTVLVNDVECTPEDIPGHRHEFSENIQGVGQVSGFYIVANARQSLPGLAVRVRGRVVKEPTLFGLDTRAHGFFTAEKIIGEVNAEFLDPEIVKADEQDLINTTRDGFLEDSPTVKAFDEWAVGFLKKIIKGIDESETKRRTDALLNYKPIKERLDRMPAHVRSTATKVVRALLAKLKNVAEDEAAELVEWVLRYYESSILRELMRAILAEDVGEAEKLGGLIQQWGLKQINSVVEIIRTQIEIITKLEELIASEKAKEIDLHKLIESNLWLVREGLELWSSDKPLKTVLEGQLDKLYKDKEDIRPDLICRSRNDGNEAVIIEFKRPKVKVVMNHVSQALEYEGLIKKHRPNISFSTYVVGRQYDDSVLAARGKLESASLFLWSFHEILQQARIRFERILEILGA